MKKTINIIAITLLIIFALTACTLTAQPTPTVTAGTNPPPTESPEPPASPSPEPTPEQTPEPTPDVWDGNSPLYYVQWDGETGRGRLIGELRDYKIQAFDPTRIYADGRALNDEVRQSLPYDADGHPAYITRTDYAPVGNVFQMYDVTSGNHAGSCILTGVQYTYEAGSGSDMVECTFQSSDVSGDGSYLVVAGMVDMQPRTVTGSEEEGGDGRYYVIRADIKGDGEEKILSWDMTTRDGNEEHTIYVLNKDERLCTVSFWYDYDFANPGHFAYTTPLNPTLLDVNGDGVYELILRAYGHNSYLHIYNWERNEYVDTGAGYYSGD